MIGIFDLLAGNNAKTEVLPSAIAFRAHFCNQFDHVFTVLISVPCFQSINVLPK